MVKPETKTIRIPKRRNSSTQNGETLTKRSGQDYVNSQLDNLMRVEVPLSELIGSPNDAKYTQNTKGTKKTKSKIRVFNRTGQNVNTLRYDVKESKRSTNYILTDDISRDLHHIESSIKRNGRMTTENITSYCPENRKSMDKKYATWLSHNVPPLAQQLSLESYLFNGMILPEECTAEESWELIKIRELLCVRHLMDIKGMEIKFIVSGIEWSEGSHEEESPDPDRVNKTKELTSEEKEKEKNLTKYVRFSIRDYEKRQEIFNLFSARTSTLKVKPAKSIGEVYIRIFEFILNNPNESEDENGKVSHVLAYPVEVLDKYIEKYYTNPYDTNFFKELGDYINKNPSVIQAAWDIIATNGVLARVPNDVHSRKDYAHIHMAIFFTNRAYNIPADEVSRHIFNKRIFMDTTVSERRNKRGRKPGSTYASAIGYALKNLKHTEPASRLQRNSCTVFNVSGDPIIEDFFSKFVITNGLQNFIDGVNYNQVHCIEGTIKHDYVLSPIYGNANGNSTPFISGKIFPKRVPPNSNDDWFLINRVREYMERNDLVLEYKSPEIMDASVRVLQKLPQSRLTFEPYKHGSLEVLWKEIKEYNPDDLTTLRKRTNVFFEYANEPNQRWFPVVKLDYSWLEYQDFFYHIHTGTVIKEQNIYPCFRYFPNQKFADIPDIATGKTIANIWYGILKNSGYMNDKYRLNLSGKSLFMRLQQLLDRPCHKRPALYLQGLKDSGKSMFIIIIASLYPDYLIGRINRQSQQFQTENVKGCMLLLMEEMQKMEREALLILLEACQRTLHNQKHKSAKSSTVNRYTTAITSNDFRWATKDRFHSYGPNDEIPLKDLDPAILSRIDTFIFNQFTHDQIDKNLEIDKVVKEELGIIILRIGLANFTELKEIQDINEIKQVAYETRRWNYWDD